jgi:hypothetical protein
VNGFAAGFFIFNLPEADKFMIFDFLFNTNDADFGVPQGHKKRK